MLGTPLVFASPPHQVEVQAPNENFQANHNDHFYASQTSELLDSLEHIRLNFSEARRFGLIGISQSTGGSLYRFARVFCLRVGFLQSLNWM